MSSQNQTEHKRVLIVSHNALSRTANNGKTLTALFADWPRDKLAQFYLMHEMPDVSICGRFFRITDEEMLRACLTRAPAQGSALDAPQDAGEAERAPQGTGMGRRLYRLVQIALAHHLPLFEWARDRVWRPRLYRSPALCAWLDDFAPEVVFFQGSNYPFAYGLVDWVCRRYGARLLLQLTDDYTYVPYKLLPMAWVNHARYMRGFTAALGRAEAVYAISPAMQAEYARRFGCANIQVAANCVPVRDATPEQPPAAPLRLLYAGSVHTGRWRSLRRLGEQLAALRAQGLEACLEVYTPGAISPRQRRALTLAPCLRYGGSLTPEALQQAMAQAHVLVMVEAFSRAARWVTRLSLSTKIPEYMAAGRCVLAFGPPDVSSIRYIQDRDAGVVVTDRRPEAMRAALRKLFDAEERARTVARASRVARENHRQELVRDALYAQIQRGVGE